MPRCLFRFTLAIVGLAAVLAALAGCRGQGRGVQRQDGLASPEAAPRKSTGGEPGLEVVAWTTEADVAVFARAIAPYARGAPAPGGLSPGAIAFLAVHGMRVVAVPVAELESLRVALGAPPRHVNQWLGQAVEWTEAVSGPDQPRGQTIALEAARLRLGAGRLRLLARSWISPAPGVGERGDAASASMMTIELLPQHDEAGRAGDHGALLAPTSISATDEGLLFPRLLMRLAARESDTAFVLVGLPPGADIERLARDAPPEPTGRGGGVGDDEGAAGAGPRVGEVVRQGAGVPGAAQGDLPASDLAGMEPGAEIGPRESRLPTIGEAIFCPPVWVTARRADGNAGGRVGSVGSVGSEGGEGQVVRTTPRRLVVALVPRLPERVRLLP